jgi:uncharacterized protein (DUF2237 family)
VVSDTAAEDVRYRRKSGNDLLVPSISQYLIAACATGQAQCICSNRRYEVGEFPVKCRVVGRETPTRPFNRGANLIASKFWRRVGACE